MSVRPPLPPEIRAKLPSSVVYDSLELAIDAVNWSRGAIGALLSRTYEEDERFIVRNLLSPGDRVIEAGTGIGLVTMIAARICGAANILSFEANPEIIETARENFARNGFNIAIRNEILMNRRARATSPSHVRFQIGDNFLTSAIAPMYPVKTTVDVPLAILEDVLAAWRATVLLLDIEGGEETLLSAADLQSIRLIIVEIHIDAMGIAACRRLVENLDSGGFSIDWKHVRGSTFAFQRSGAGVDNLTSMNCYFDALASEKSGDIKGAADQFSRLAEMQPESFHLVLRTAECLIATKACREAAALFGSCSSTSKTGPGSLLLWTKALFRDGDLDKAEAILRMGLSSGTKTPALWSMLGRVMEAQRKLNGAQTCFGKSIELDPTNARPYLASAKLLMRLGKTSDSEVQNRLAKLLAVNNQSQGLNNVDGSTT